MIYSDQRVGELGKSRKEKQMYGPYKEENLYSVEQKMKEVRKQPNGVKGESTAHL